MSKAETQSKTTQTRENLMEAFWSLYCHKRIEKITVKDVTLKAGYNRGTFYEYFPDVYAVLEEIENRLIPSLDQLPPLSMAGGQLVGGHLAEGQMGMPVDAFMALYQKNHKYYSVLLGDKGDPAFAGKLKGVLKANLMQSLAGQPGVDLVALDYVLEYTLSSMIGVMRYWLMHEQPISQETLYELLHRLMDKGVIGVMGDVFRRTADGD